MPDPSLPSRKSRPTVFLIEDEPELRRSLQLLLQGRGFAVRAFASPQALLADPALLAADCLIADYRMPELDGLELMAALRERGWRAPAILITAFPSASLVAQAVDLGYTEVLVKPFLDRSLVTALTQLVGT